MNLIKNKGFTLLELLVVIATIGILASIVIGSISDSKKKASFAFVQSSLVEIRKQAEIYYSNNGNYGTAQSYDTFLSSDTNICNNTCFLDDPIIFSSLQKFDPHVGPYYAPGHPNQQHDMSYVISTDKQRWAIAVTSLVGPRTYCVDSSGNTVRSSGDQYATIYGRDGKCL